MTKDLRLDDRVVVISGGSSGVGLATGLRARALGARVANLDVTEGPSEFLTLRCDVSDSSAVDASAREIRDKLGPVSSLVNNAGVISQGAIGDVTPASWQRTLAVNLTGAFNCVRAFLPAMRPSKNGSIVVVSSVGGRWRSFNGDIAYASSKGALLTFARHLAAELADEGIRVNCVCPGAVDTPMYRRLTEGGDPSVLRQRVPLGRAARAEEIASVICFLLADASSYMTGQIVDVNGGML